MLSYVMGREKLKSVARIAVFLLVQNIHYVLTFHVMSEAKKHQ